MLDRSSINAHFFPMNQLTPERRAQVISALVEGRALARQVLTLDRRCLGTNENQEM